MARQRKAKPSSNGKDKALPQVKVRPLFPSSQRSVFANHMIAQATEHEIHLSFFDIRPPLFPDGFDPKDGVEVESECVTQIVISRDRGPKFVLALAQVLGIPIQISESPDESQEK